jgi:hypothetical protein
MLPGRQAFWPVRQRVCRPLKGQRTECRLRAAQDWKSVFRPLVFRAKSLVTPQVYAKAGRNPDMLAYRFTTGCPRLRST